jgi:hypothetical protein
MTARDAVAMTAIVSFENSCVRLETETFLVLQGFITSADEPPATP